MENRHLNLFFFCVLFIWSFSSFAQFKAKDKFLTGAFGGSLTKNSNSFVGTYNNAVNVENYSYYVSLETKFEYFIKSNYSLSALVDFSIYGGKYSFLSNGVLFDSKIRFNSYDIGLANTYYYALNPSTTLQLSAGLGLLFIDENAFDNRRLVKTYEKKLAYNEFVVAPGITRFLRPDLAIRFEIPIFYSNADYNEFKYEEYSFGNRINLGLMIKLND